MKPGFEQQAEKYRQALEKNIEAHTKKNFPNLTPKKVGFDKGRKFWRVWTADSVSKSAHSFLDTETGDILKPAGWKGPAKHPRGNIFSADVGMSGVGAYGAKYLRGRSIGGFGEAVSRKSLTTEASSTFQRKVDDQLEDIHQERGRDYKWVGNTIVYFQREEFDDAMDWLTDDDAFDVDVDSRFPRLSFEGLDETTQPRKKVKKETSIVESPITAKTEGESLLSTLTRYIYQNRQDIKRARKSVDASNLLQSMKNLVGAMEQISATESISASALRKLIRTEILNLVEKRK